MLIVQLFFDRINMINMIVFPACASYLSACGHAQAGADRHPVDFLV
ncbi:MAG: hypothetical protein U9N82_13470 [Thermodesulfobacteriota bacterium]|nr:hypothetical protein [Thermodesulfobacteriota bacterium]